MSFSRWMYKKTVDIQTVEYYSLLKIKALLSHEKTYRSFKWIQDLYQLWYLHIFLSVVSLFILLTMFSEKNKFLNLMKYNLLVFSFMDDIFGIKSKMNICLTQGPMIYSERFVYLSFNLGLWSIWVNFYIQFNQWIKVHFCAWSYPVFSVLFDEKTIFSPLNCLYTFIKKINYSHTWVYLWTLYSVLSIYMSILFLSSWLYFYTVLKLLWICGCIWKELAH